MQTFKVTGKDETKRGVLQPCTATTITRTTYLSTYTLLRPSVD